MFGIVGYRQKNHFRSELWLQAVGNLSELAHQGGAYSRASNVNEVEQNDFALQRSERNWSPVVIDH